MEQTIVKSGFIVLGVYITYKLLLEIWCMVYGLIY